MKKSNNRINYSSSFNNMHQKNENEKKKKNILKFLLRKLQEKQAVFMGILTFIDTNAIFLQAIFFIQEQRCLKLSIFIRILKNIKSYTLWSV